MDAVTGFSFISGIGATPSPAGFLRDEREEQVTRV
jgi:hypothetical protein